MSTREAVILEPGQGRAYQMGRISAVFKADGAETQDRYTISEWWLEPHTQGPGPHSHDNDDTFYVIEGTMSVLVGERWIHANKGSFILVPGGVVHDFQNRTDQRAGLLNVGVPGAFEPEMPAIADWFAEHPPKDA
jgi:quercetin dioxygenase-like cupin family protein